MYIIYNYVVVVSGDERSKNFVVGDGQGLGEEVGQVTEPRNVDDTELPLVDATRSQWNRISKDFDIFGVTVLLARPIAHSLSHEMTVGG